jgi:hypothetical protein
MADMRLERADWNELALEFEEVADEDELVLESSLRRELLSCNPEINMPGVPFL